jgi:uncharacterized 2Fe-2S/4Fe-4S cluster protein (DUF4445 family)
MPIIKFKPFGKEIDVPAGTELLDAIRSAGIEIQSSCGGEGTCRKCIVRVLSGDVESNGINILPKTISNEGFVLACKIKISNSPVTIEIPEPVSAEEGMFLDETETSYLIRKELLPQDWQYDPLAVKWYLEVPEPQLEDGLSDLNRLTRTIQKDWGKREIIYSFPVIQKVADILRKENGKVTVILIRASARYHVIGIEAGDQTIRNFGIAVDVGTTTIAVKLVFLPTAKVIDTHTAYNEQVECGLDVISRINYAQKPERLLELRKRVLKSINALVKRVCKTNHVNREEVCNAVIAGNTTMIHLLLGLVPEYIRLQPYTPTILEAPYLTAAEVGIDINPQSWVYISPGVGSYVGGDITSGLLCTDLAANSEDINLFIDIGTNGELVIGNCNFLMTCACSAGPAFEGGGIEFGMRASHGAIEQVDIDPETGVASYQTIGDVRPIGICGSGMISLLANLFLTGWIDAVGKLNRSKQIAAIQIDGKQAKYIIVPADQSASNKPITINEPDIENIIRSKAAIFSACSLMLEQVGLSCDDLCTIYIAGGFGRFLNIENAIAIGLLPDLPREKFKYIGNSSLMGAYMVLVSQDYRERQINLCKQMTYIELNTNPNYMDQYTGAMFLPHTDINRFPTVKPMIHSHHRELTEI